MKWVSVFLAVILLAVFPAFPAAAEETTTVMLYLCGSDLESQHGLASSDLEEIMDAQMDAENVTVVAMLSGSKAWDMAFEPFQTYLCEIGKRGMRTRETMDAMNMGDSETLRYFLDYAYTHYPADHYCLILWDHGGGPMMGVCFDELFPGAYGRDSLSLTELSSALEQSPFAEKKLSWIGFDACLMASVETAAAVAPYADYMIASQDTEPGSGWNYGFLAEMGDDSSPEETGRRIIDGYFEAAGDTLATVTLSMVDLSVLPEIMEKMDAVFGAVQTPLSSDEYNRFTACRVDVKGMADTSPSDYDLIDLGDLLAHYSEAGMADCGDLSALLDRAIVASRANMPSLNGLSVYYPYYNKEEYLAYWSSQRSDFSVGYQAFLDGILSVWLGEPLADWSTGLRLKEAVMPGQNILSMQLTEEQAQYFDSADYYILEKTGENEYRFLYMSDDVTLTPEQQLQSVYDGKALFMVDDAGNRLTDEISYFFKNDALLIPAMLMTKFLTKDFDIVPVYLVYRLDENGKYALAEVVPSSDGDLVFGRSELQLSDWYEIQFAGFNFVPTYDESGRLRHLYDWDPADSAMVESLLLEDGKTWHPELLPLYGAQERVALMHVRDNQNHLVCVEMLPIHNPNLTQVAGDDQTLLDCDSCRIVYSGMTIAEGIQARLKITFTCENKTDGELELTVKNMAVNGTVLDTGNNFMTLDPGQQSIELYYPAETLRQAHLTEGREFTVTLVGEKNGALWSDPPLFEERAGFVQPVDFSAISAPVDDRQPLAAVQTEGLELALYELGLDAQKRVTGCLWVRNTGNEDTLLEAPFVRLNGVRCNNMMQDIFLPAGYDTYLSFSAATVDKMALQWPPNATEPLSLLEISEISRITFHLEDSSGKETEAAFLLTEPLAYPAGTPVPTTVVYDQDGVTLRLISAHRITEDQFSDPKWEISFAVSNQTDVPVQLGAYSNALVNGALGNASFSENKIAPCSIDCVSMRFEIKDEPAPDSWTSFEAEFHVYDAAGRNDWQRLRLETLDAPETIEIEGVLDQEFYYVYNADRLLLSCTPISLLPGGQSARAILADARADAVLFDQDGVRIVFAGSAVYPEDPLRRNSRFVYFALENRTDSDLFLISLYSYLNKASVYTALPLKFVPVGWTVFLEAEIGNGDQPADETFESILIFLNLSISNADISEILPILISTADVPPQVMQMCETPSVSGMVYGAEALNVRVEPLSD